MRLAFDVARMAVVLGSTVSLFVSMWLHGPLVITVLLAAMTLLALRGFAD